MKKKITISKLKFSCNIIRSRSFSIFCFLFIKIYQNRIVKKIIRKITDLNSIITNTLLYKAHL